MGGATSQQPFYTGYAALDDFRYFEYLLMQIGLIRRDIDLKTNFHRVSFTIFFKFEGTKEISFLS